MYISNKKINYGATKKMLNKVEPESRLNRLSSYASRGMSSLKTGNITAHYHMKHRNRVSR